MAKQKPSPDLPVIREDEYQLLFELAGVGIGYFTTEGDIISFNKIAAMHMNGEPEDFNGKSIREFFTEEEVKFYMKRLKESAGSEVPIVYEDKITLPSGTKWLKNTYTRIENRDGKIKGIQVVSTEITEQKQTEEKLTEKDFLLQSIFNTTPTLIYIYDIINQCNIFSNKEVTDFLGYSDEQIREMGSSLFSNILHPDDFKHVAAHHAQFHTLPQQESRLLEYRMKHTSGQWRWLRSRDILFRRNEQDHVLQILGSTEDITEQKLAEEALKISEEKFRAIFKNNSAAIAIMEADTSISMVNDAYCKMGGYTEDEVVGISWTTQIYPDDLERLKEYNRKRLMNPNDAPDNYEFRFYRKDGQLRYGLISVSVIESLRKIVTSFVDVTDQKKAEEELGKSYLLLNTMLDNNPALIYMLDTEGKFIFVNRQVEKLFGKKRHEINGKTREFIMPKELADKHFSNDLKVMEKGIALVFEEENFESDGVHYYLTTKFPLRDNLNNIYGVSGISTDITERRQIEEKIKESESKFRKIYEDGPLGMAIADSSLSFMHANATFCRMMGYSEHELQLMTFKELTHPDHLSSDLEGIKKLYNGEIPAYKTIKKYIRKDHQIIWGSLTATANFNQEGQFLYFVSMIEDITSRKKAEEELLQKMDELQRFHHHSVDRELTMIEMKKEINELLRQAGKEEKYKIRK